MAETFTTGHNLSKFGDGDNAGAAKLNANWTTTDTRLIGIGDAFPATWPVTGMFLRRDEKTLYENTGTEGTPVFTVVLDTGAGTTPVFDETPSGAINGVNDTFTLVTAPNPPASLRLYMNGLRLKAGVGNDYTLAGDTITFNASLIPIVGDVLVADYTV